MNYEFYEYTETQFHISIFARFVIHTLFFVTISYKFAIRTLVYFVISMVPIIPCTN